MLPGELPTLRAALPSRLPGVFGAGVLERLSSVLFAPPWTAPFSRPPVGTVPLRARSRRSRPLLCSSSSVLGSLLPSGWAPSCCSGKVGFFPMCVTRNLQQGTGGSKALPSVLPLFPSQCYFQLASSVGSSLFVASPC